MKVQSLKLVYFSPTGTTKAVVQSIARGINQKDVKLIDITKPDMRNEQLQVLENELLVVGVPVYMGRVPALLCEWLHTIKAKNTPTVCVVVYGNREYDNALLELKDILVKCGCKLIAGAAYIGEHSFSSSKIPIAAGRPDASDLNHAELFGREINDKLLAASSISHISDINMPGIYPYQGVTRLWDVDFITVSDECTQCGICTEGCPTAAIDLRKSNCIDIERCITCCACIKNCPQNARSIKNSSVKEAAIRLNKLCADRKEPVSFL